MDSLPKNSLRILLKTAKVSLNYWIPHGAMRLPFLRRPSTSSDGQRLTRTDPQRRSYEAERPSLSNKDGGLSPPQDRRDLNKRANNKEEDEVARWSPHPSFLRSPRDFTCVYISVPSRTFPDISDILWNMEKQKTWRTCSWFINLNKRV